VAWTIHVKVLSRTWPYQTDTTVQNIRFAKHWYVLVQTWAICSLHRFNARDTEVTQLYYGHNDTQRIVSAMAYSTKMHFLVKSYFKCRYKLMTYTIHHSHGYCTLVKHWNTRHFCQRSNIYLTHSPSWLNVQYFPFVFMTHALTR